jgi:flagellar basal-body rod modification protein FlgD
LLKKRGETMDFTATMSATDQLYAKNTVDAFNKTLTVNGRQQSNQLGKDDFLKLLLAQLANQDPTSPMENTEFIAQMAQFSSLEQMTNMSTEFSRLANMLHSNEAINIIGKRVDIEEGALSLSGQVDGAVLGANPQVEINGMLYSMEAIKRVYSE